MSDLKEMSTYSLKRERENLIIYLDRISMETNGNKKLESELYPDLDWRRRRLSQIDYEIKKRTGDV